MKFKQLLVITTMLGSIVHAQTFKVTTLDQKKYLDKSQEWQ